MRRLFTSAVMLGLPLLVGCTDLRDFNGDWSGPIIAEPAVRQGFSANAEVTKLTLSNIALSTAEGLLSTSDDKFKDARLSLVARSVSDELASMSFENDPLRSYLMFGKLTSDPRGAPAVMIVSLFGNDEVQLRIFRGNDLYGVFYLRRSP
jgi:hypothetical protein